MYENQGKQLNSFTWMGKYTQTDFLYQTDIIPDWHNV